ncbi:DgyrCDS9871 [Dimorphilus gyrociliatus]|uniref:DgyrCDS9871 n=1 Tax=Dimorphilus gyrociliatus TaxID=2664684 RepID=A0A7I8VYP3_9ANNE|nr:DgyrCDS9871 [Dimorphilus gyrociliatus]
MLFENELSSNDELSINLQSECLRWQRLKGELNDAEFLSFLLNMYETFKKDTTIIDINEDMGGNMSKSIEKHSRKPVIKKNLRDIYQKSELSHNELDISSYSGKLQKILDTKKTSIHNISVFRCDLCSFANLNKSEFEKHLQESNHHLTSVEDFNCRNFKVTCNICNIGCFNERTLVAHKRRKHESLEFRCSYEDCKFVSKHKDSLKAHLNFQHGDKNKYVCSFCAKGFKRPDHLRLHEKTHELRDSSEEDNRTEGTRTQQTKCNICDAICKSELHRIIHEKSMHSLMPFQGYYVCPKYPACQFKSEMESSVVSHARIKCSRREGVLKFKCRYCSKLCSSYSARFSHEKRHLRKKDHKCDLCLRAFLTTTELTSHKKSVHSDVRPIPCKICNQTFKKRFNLRRHMLKHTGEKPHKCIICSVAYADSTTLKKHWEKEHNIVDVSCLKDKEEVLTISQDF